ncbi:hypothetical protein ELQ92_00895 [Labedella populi]|uniref:Uncharacterized protein n=1 Tax=Labedella populi TaxID=2498850 RepID=A0A3S5CP20_9MICO|nr:hypothetical protein [Labedella populi]RWZ67860.1 hypothetical protein ELQ92_00895 [Labedella populi]
MTELSPVPADCLYDYKGVCWWCGAEATSREHKWKRTEVTKIFGRGHYGDDVAWLHDDTVESLRGPKAAGFMFSKSLCHTCNGARSQPFDDAYSIWSDYLIENHDEILELPLADVAIDFGEVFGTDIDEMLPLLGRYYAKHIGCRVAENAGRVPDSLIAYLSGEVDQPVGVFSQLGVRIGLVDIIDQFEGDSLMLSLRASAANYDRTRRILTSFKSGVGVGALEFFYDINLDPDAEVGPSSGILRSPQQTLWLHDENVHGVQMMVEGLAPGA